MLCVLFLYSLSYLTIVLRYLAIDWQCIAYCLLGVVFAWCIGVYYCRTITLICVIYWLSVYVVLVCLCWLLSLSVCSAVYFVPAGLLVSYLAIIPLISIYRFISLLFVLLLPWCVAGIIYDKAPLKGAYLLVLVLLGWYLYFIFPLLAYTNKKG